MVPYDLFIQAFLEKITEFELLQMEEAPRTEAILGYMKRAIIGFKNICQYDLVTTQDDDFQCFNVEIEPEDLDEIVDIVSEGMVMQWLKTYLNRQELLENSINTKDFTTYSPANLLMRVGERYASAKKEYVQMVREYSYNHGDLTDLHL